MGALDLLFGWLCLLAGVVLLGGVLWLVLYAGPAQLTPAAVLVGWVAVYLGTVAVKSAKPCIRDGLAWRRWRRAHPPEPKAASDTAAGATPPAA